MDVEVGLISERKAIVQASFHETVGTLKRRGGVALGVGTGRLLDSSGCVVEGTLPMKTARVQNGDSFTVAQHGSNSSRRWRVCCHSGRRIRRDLGQC